MGKIAIYSTELTASGRAENFISTLLDKQYRSLEHFYQQLFVRNYVH